uniref:MFS domain-containing protein n=1 Tax=Schistosoma mansoni TaxID=6183 RepID=A0A5K4F490_SCHMA
MDATVKRPLGLLILLFWSYFFTSLARRAIQNIYHIIPVQYKGTKSNTHLGSIITAQTLGYTVTKLIGGILMDHLNPLRIFIYSLISASGSLFLLSVSSHQTVWLVSYGLTGLALGSSWPAISKTLRTRISSWPRRRILLIIIQMLIASGTLMCLSWITNHNASLTILLIISLTLGITVIGAIALCGVLAVELAPPAFSGTAHALSALTANFGAILAGYPFALLAEHINWSGAFLVAGIVCGLSVIPLSCF